MSVAASVPLHPLPTLAERTVRGLDIITSSSRLCPLVAGLLSTNSLASLYGPPGALKSFVALDLALCVATGCTFHGRDVLSGPVLYVVAEGAGGIGPRVDAWVDANPGDIDHITWLKGGISLSDKAQVAELADLIAYITPALVVVDTFARCTPGVDENSARDLGVVISHLDALREASGAAILLVHHAGKDVSKGLRGSSALAGAVDTTLLMQRTRTGATLTVDKHRDGADDEVERFRLVPRRDSAILALEERGETTTFRPTWLMARLSEIVEGEPGLTFRVLTEQRLDGHSREHKRTALRCLVKEGFVRTEVGPREAHLHYHVIPFRDDEP
jgi:RecA-family ATPase